MTSAMDSFLSSPKWTPTPPQSQTEEWINTLTHGLGLVLSLGGALVLCSQAVICENGILVFGSITYSISLILVYLSSTLSHAIQNQTWRFRWRVLDQGFIYLLIAGSYTGFSLPLLSVERNRYLLMMVWVLALVCFFHRTVIRAQSDKSGTVSYLALGWVPIFTFYGSVALLPPAAIFWLIAGGLCYSGGVVFLLFDQRVRYFHAIWHLLVILGSLCHFLGIYRIVVTVGLQDRL